MTAARTDPHAGSPARALGFLLGRTIANRARQLGRRLRSPRYLVALLLGTGYLFFLLAEGGRVPAGTRLPPAALELMGATGLAVLLGKWWLAGTSPSAVALSAAEAQFLLPAPLGHRWLIGYRIVRNQLPIVMNAAIATVLVGSGAAGLPVGLRFISFWVLFSNLSIHRLGSVLARASIARGEAGTWQAWAPLVILATGVGLSMAALTRAGDEAGAALAALAQGDFTGFSRLAADPLLRTGLAPFLIAIRPVVSESTGSWLPAIAASATLCAAQFLWVLSLKTGFEEIVAHARERRARGARAARTGRRKAAAARWRVPLAPRGHPANAILWKNLLHAARQLSAAAVLGAAVILLSGPLVGFLAGGVVGALTVYGGLALTWGTLLLIFGPLWVHHDLRGDIAVFDLVRTWPLEGRAIVAVESLSSAVLLTLVEGLLLASGLGTLALAGDQVLRAQSFLWIASGLLVLLPFNLLAVGVQNGLVLLFPGWGRTEIRPGGFDALGQLIINTGMSLAVVALLAAGPIAAGAGVQILVASHSSAGSLLAGSVVAAAALLAVAWRLFHWLGAVLARTEPLTS